MTIILALEPHAQVEAESGGVRAAVDPALATVSVNDDGDLVVEVECSDFKDTVTIPCRSVIYDALAQAAFRVRDIQQRSSGRGEVAA